MSCEKPPITILWPNDEQSYTDTCPPDMPSGSPITVTIPAGTYGSSISKAIANQIAYDAAVAQAAILRAEDPCGWPEVFGPFTFDDPCAEFDFWLGCPIYFDPDYLYAWDDSEQYVGGPLELIDSWILGGGPWLPHSIFFDPDHFYAWENFDQYPPGEFDNDVQYGGGMWNPNISGRVFYLDYYMATMGFLDETPGTVLIVTSDGDENPFDTGLWATDGILFDPT